jgi:hypothetical protein
MPHAYPRTRDNTIQGNNRSLFREPQDANKYNVGGIKEVFFMLNQVVHRVTI